MIKRDKKKDENFVTLQVTLFDKEGRYKPVSTLIKVESVKYYKEHKKEVHQKAIEKICRQKYWSGNDLVKYGYSIIKVRNYDLVVRGRKEREDKQG